MNAAISHTNKRNQTNKQTINQNIRPKWNRGMDPKNTMSIFPIGKINTYSLPYHLKPK